MQRSVWTCAFAMILQQLLLGPPAPVHANEVAAEIGAGGLLFVNDPSIAIEAMEISIRLDDVRASYVLRNASTRPRTIMIAFVLPDIDMAALGDQRIVLAEPSSANFVAAAISADGLAIIPEIALRSLAFGVDVSETLATSRIPLSPIAASVQAALDRLAPSVKADLGERGIVRLNGNRAEPNWTLKTTIHWRQAFPPGKPVALTLSYVPVAARAPFSSEQLDVLRKSHCIDSTVEAAITRRVVAGAGNATFRWLGFNLASGGPSSTPIGSFRLLIEKPDIETVVSTCRRGLRSIGPTALEWQARNFEPDEDLHVLFVR